MDMHQLKTLEKTMKGRGRIKNKLELIVVEN